jgi:hypothetical protein
MLTDLDFAFCRDEDVCRFEVTVDDPVVMQVSDAIDDLPKERLEHGYRDRRPCRGMVMDDLLPSGVRQTNGLRQMIELPHEKVVLGIFKDHVDRLFLEHDLAQSCEIDIVQFSVELRGQEVSTDSETTAYPTHHNLSASTLADPSVGDELSLLVWLEFLDRDDLALDVCSALAVLALVCRRVAAFGRAPRAHPCLVDSAIGARRDESDDRICRQHAPAHRVAVCSVRPHGRLRAVRHCVAERDMQLRDASLMLGKKLEERDPTAVEHSKNRSFEEHRDRSPRLFLFFLSLSSLSTSTCRPNRTLVTPNLSHQILVFLAYIPTLDSSARRKRQTKLSSTKDSRNFFKANKDHQVRCFLVFSEFFSCV